jgi:hypothetical protein
MPDSDADAKIVGQEGATPENRISRAFYSNADIIQRFEAAMDSLDLKAEITEIGHGLGSIFKRGRAIRDFRAVCVVMWRLSLEKSFPDQQEEVYRDFMAGSRILGDGGGRKKLVERINLFWEVLEPQKSADFTPLAIYLAGNLSQDLDNRKVLQLKLSLTIRRIYNFVFESLI